MSRIFRKTGLAAVMFLMGYLTTITVNAADAIQLNGDNAVITGTVLSADDNTMRIDSAGKEMLVDLDDVELKAPAESMFERGMMVSIDGKITGEDFGVPIVEAKSVTATEPVPEVVE